MVKHDIAEEVGLFLPIEVFVEIGDDGPGHGGLFAAERDEAVGLREGRRREQHALDEGEDGGVGTDADREGENGDGGEAGGLGELAGGRAERGHGATGFGG